MTNWMQEAQKYGPEWDRIAADVRKRDDWTCQRCGIESGPHAGDHGRILDVHHIVWKSRGGGDDMENLVTLCRPCHGVQHPENSNFDRHRHRASLYPAADADERVAFVNSSTEGETPDAFLSRRSSRTCRRCGRRAAHRDDLIVYPNYSPSDLDGDPPDEKCRPLCEPCAGLVLSNDDDATIDDLRTVGNDPAPRDITTRVEEALISGYVTNRKFGATREPVNRKEWFLFESPYRYLHYFWRHFATVALFVVFTALLARDLGGLAAQMNATVPMPVLVWGTYDMVVLAPLGAGIGAYTVRWSVAALTQRLWRLFDRSIEPHHFERAVWPKYREKIHTLLYFVALPYSGLVLLAMALAVFL